MAAWRRRAQLDAEKVLNGDVHPWLFYAKMVLLAVYALVVAVLALRAIHDWRRSLRSRSEAEGTPDAERRVPYARPGRPTRTPDRDAGAGGETGGSPSSVTPGDRARRRPKVKSVAPAIRAFADNEVVCELCLPAFVFLERSLDELEVFKCHATGSNETLEAVLDRRGLPA